MDYESSCVPGQEIPGDETEQDFSEFPAIEHPPPKPTYEIVPKIFFYVVSFLLAVIGNSLVIAIITLNRKIRTTTNCLILNLAVSDLMVGLFCMWPHLGANITTQWPFGPFVCKVNNFVQVMAVTASVLTLTIISVERFIAIMFPMGAKMTPFVAAICMVTTWAVAIGTGTPYLFVRKQFEVKWKDLHEIWCKEDWTYIYIDTDCKTDAPAKKIYITVQCTVMYFIPVVVMLAVYTAIMIKVILRKKPGSRTGSIGGIHEERMKRKVVRMLLIVVVVFIICWTPQQVIMMWDVYTWEMPPYMKRLKFVALYIAYLNSALNPIIYGALNENFRQGFMEAFKCHLWSKRNTVAPASVVGSAASSVPASVRGFTPMNIAATTNTSGV